MKKTLSIVLCILLVLLAVACSPEHTHDYKLVPEKSIEATCESNGYNYMECSCGAIQSIPTAALGHDPVVKVTKEPTCVTVGQRVITCSRCDTYNVQQTIAVDPDSHVFKIDDDESDLNGKGVVDSITSATVKTWPTCGKDGLGVFTYCSACKKSGEFEVVIPKEYVLGAIGHVTENTEETSIAKHYTELSEKTTKTWINDSEPTAFVNGLKHAECPTCGKDLKDETKKTEKVFPYVDVPTVDSAVLGTYSLEEKNTQDKTWSLETLELTESKGYKTAKWNLLKKRDGAVDSWTSDFTSEKDTIDPEKKDLSGNTNWCDGNENSVLGLSNTIYLIAGDSLQSGFTFIAQVVDADKANCTGAKNGDYVLGLVKDGSWMASDDWTKALTVTDLRVVEKSNHFHEWKLMEGRGAITNDTHYLYCDCGMSYCAENHNPKGDCDFCGRKSSWIEFVISKSGEIDAFCVEKDYELYLPASTSMLKYTTFSGASVDYNTVSASSDAIAATGKTGYWKYSGTSGKATLAIAES